MIFKRALLVTASLVFLPANASAQEATERSKMTMGNGIANAIQVEGLTRQKEEAVASEVRVDGSKISTFRTNTTAITFPEVKIATTGWLVLHPVIDGRPDGDIVSGFAYLEQGKNENITVKIQHATGAGDKFLVMLHNDVDRDRIFDFVFVEDGINVEDTAVFEGSKMIAHVIALPK